MPALYIHKVVHNGESKQRSFVMFYLDQKKSHQNKLGTSGSIHARAGNWVAMGIAVVYYVV